MYKIVDTRSGLTVKTVATVEEVPAALTKIRDRNPTQRASFQARKILDVI